jgi:SAM-dependent methyltransferase
MDYHELSPKEKWDGRYGAAGYEPDKSPVPFLADAIVAIPPGRALCLAAGCGRNAVYLAQCGFEVTAVDVSSRGLDRCQELADDLGVQVDTVTADLLSYDMARETFDLITDFYYYEPELFAPIKEAVKPGGYFLLQTFSIHHRRAGRTRGPQSARHLADPPLVLEAFRDWRIHLFGDLDVVQSGDDGDRTDSLVRLLAQKPAD